MAVRSAKCWLVSEQQYSVQLKEIDTVQIIVNAVYHKSSESDVILTELLKNKKGDFLRHSACTVIKIQQLQICYIIMPRQKEFLRIPDVI